MLFFHIGVKLRHKIYFSINLYWFHVTLHVIVHSNIRHRKQMPIFKWNLKWWNSQLKCYGSWRTVEHGISWQTLRFSHHIELWLAAKHWSRCRCRPWRFVHKELTLHQRRFHLSLLVLYSPLLQQLRRLGEADKNHSIISYSSFSPAVIVTEPIL